ncbi:hypothetical protein DFS33DRAFT_874341 [Desarmillaria ectypa]|nr:hypothetical protein DFS33DRAFT_874341 [Desarmillaria ectypa]
MRFTSCISLLALVSAVAAGGGGSYPSSTPGHGWLCPDHDGHGNWKAGWGCDAPPYKGPKFGCTFRTGSTGWYSCSFDAKSGKCAEGEDSKCPSFASYSGKKKRDPEAAPAPVPILRGSRPSCLRDTTRTRTFCIWTPCSIQIFITTENSFITPSLSFCMVTFLYWRGVHRRFICS